MDMDYFYVLRTRLRRGERLSLQDKATYRSLGRQWIVVLRALRDSQAVKGIKRDLGLLKRGGTPPTDAMKEVLL